MRCTVPLWHGRFGRLTSRRLTSRRALFVPAHPDDESINNGEPMAEYAAEGAAVTLVTRPLGEGGPSIPVELAHLAADREGRLGQHR